MSVELPVTARPEDIHKLLLLLPSTEIPKEKVEAGYIKSLGFSPASSRQLLKILRMLSFLDEKDKPSASWLAYVADEKRGLVLAAGLKMAYDDLFHFSRCPYLEDDEVLLDYIKRSVKASPKNMELMLQTFRSLSELADFQDLLCNEGTTEQELPPTIPEVKVNPNLQLNLQIHIDPNTPDDKIETIFRNMRKYLLGKE
jgi:hypothetical protein